MKSTQGTNNPGLRRKAEQMLVKKPKTQPTETESEKFKLLHELEVHQIELELQNEELSRAKTVAQEAADKYTELYDFAPFAYFTLSSSGRILEMNLPGSQLLGKERSKVINTPFDFYISEDTRIVFFDFLEKAFKSHVKESCELTIITGDKKSLFIQVNGIAIGNASQCLINIIDVTERKQAEKALIESQRLGAIGEMTSSIAHDFNNSLQVICGNLELALLTDNLSESVTRYLKTIQVTARDATKRVKILRRFGDIKTDRRNFSLTDLNILINEVIAQMRPIWKDEAERKGLSVILKTKLHDIPRIVCDQGDLRTVLYNVFINSIEAMPNGGELLVETGRRTHEVFITISDNGIGMSEEIKTRIFQPFFSTKGLDIGRGLGMSGVFTIVKEHGGNVFVKSTVQGKGTVIEITFPVSDEETAESKQDFAKPANTGKQLSILWVDDEENIRKMAAEMVKILGHTIDTAGSGKEALKYLGQKKYNLVITDLGMNEMNGWQLADTIRNKYGKSMKIAVISGWGDQITEADLSSHGIDYKIDKPFTLVQLKNTLEVVQGGKT
ncbi:MAG TPA: response regulator [Bacteroidales bacterium]|nr:response regulator [Bacteroidales bacterium]